MRQTIPLGRVAGIRIGAHWSVLVIIVLIGWLLRVQVLPVISPQEPEAVYWGVAIPVAIAFVAALLAHELAHSLVARHYGVPVTSITLWALGGLSELGKQPPTARADLRIAVAGPAASVAAGVIFEGAALALGFAGGPRIAVAGLSWLAVMNFFLAVFNLLPGAPLDGGRILRALLWKRYGDRARAARSATRAGRVLGTALVALGFAEILFLRDGSGLWLALVGWFIIGAAAAEGRMEGLGELLAGLRVGDIMTADPDIGVTWMSVAGFIDHVALRSDQDWFPVLRPDGSLAGVTEVGRLSRIPAARRASTTLAQVMAEVPDRYVAAPQDPAASLLSRPPIAGGLLAVVISEGRVVGIVTATRLNQFLQRAELRPRPGPWTREQQSPEWARQPNGPFVSR